MAISRQDFAQMIKQKYPDAVTSAGVPYSQINDDELVDAVLAKFPVYRGQVAEKNAFQKVGDFLFSSTQKFGGTLGTAASVMDPETNKSRDEALQSRQLGIDRYLKLAQGAVDPGKKKEYVLAAQKLGNDQGIDIFNSPEYQKTTKQILGEAGGTLLEALAFSSIGKAPAAVKKLTAGKNILKGLGEGAGIGSAFGGGFGATQAMQQNKSTGDILKEAGQGAVFGGAAGGVLGAGLSAAGVGASALGGKIAELKPLIRSKVGEIAYNKLLDVSRNILKMSPTAARNESRWMKNTPKFLVDEGIVNLIESDGKFISTKNALEALKVKYEAENAAFNRLLVDDGSYISLNKLKSQALAAIGDLRSRGSDLKAAQKHIKNEIAAYYDNYANVGIKQGDDLLIPIDVFNEIKSGLWKKTSNFNPTLQDKLISDLNYIMGHEAKDIIEQTVKDAQIKLFNSRLGDFASAMKVLQNAEGKVLPGGFFGRQFTKIAGSIAGASGGIPGVIVGNLTGGALADLTSNPKIKTSVLYKVLQLLGKSPEGKSMIEEAAQILQKRGEERAARKLLQAPKTIFSNPPKDTSKLFSQDEARQVLQELGIPDQPLKNNPVVGQTADSLMAEARKYKSAEEFVRAQPTYYRGATTEKVGGFEGRGTFLTSDKKYANIFAGKDGKTFEYKVDPNKLKIQKSVAPIEEQVAKELWEFTDDLIERPQDFKNQIAELKAKGINALESFDGRQLLVLDNNLIKTKSQLTDIWNKANKK